MFRVPRDGGYMLEDHPGGCTLFARKDEVEAILANTVKESGKDPE